MMHSKLHQVLIAIAFAMVATSTYAQKAPLDGSRPPAVSVSDASRAQSSSAAISTPITSGLPQVTGLPTPGNLPSPPPPTPAAGVLTTMPPPEKPKRTYKAPPVHLTVEPGKNVSFGIAVGHINRIVTPFAQPTLRTTSTAQSSIEGSIVYVATDSHDPIGVFIFDKSAPEQAISLTLVPEVIEPVSTSLQVAGWIGTPDRPSITKSATRALALEGEHPYLQTLTEILRVIAQGKIPDGYGMQDLSDAAVSALPTCSIPGITVRPMQVLDGGAFRAIVARATNASTGNAEIVERLCSGAGLRAVAAWPHTRLAPGQSTELYLVVSTVIEQDPEQRRPSVLGGR